MSDWRSAAKAAILEAVAALPADATDAEQRKAISAAYPFGVRENHPYKVWLAEVRRYFGTYRPSESAKRSGQRYRAQRVADETARKIAEREAANGKSFPKGGGR